MLFFGYYLIIALILVSLSNIYCPKILNAINEFGEESAEGNSYDDGIY